jgi:diguanylate cyclase (GGDEF)-like protein
VRRESVLAFTDVRAAPFALLTTMPLRVLLVESEPEDILFLQDVLTEIGDGGYWSQWLHIETLHAANWTDASAILIKEPVDIILLDLDLADGRGMETFRWSQTVAQHIPVVVLTTPSEEIPGVRLLRDGAQDILLKKQVDCAPLASAMRNAIERHRLLTSIRATTMHDSLTGLLNRSGFVAFADRDRKLAERLQRRLLIMVAEPPHLSEMLKAYGDQRRDLALIEAADHLRSLASPTDVVARIGDTRFGLSVLETGVESVEAAWARVHSDASEHRILVGAAMFDGDHPASLDALLEMAAQDLAPIALAMRR